MIAYAGMSCTKEIKRDMTVMMIVYRMTYIKDRCVAQCMFVDNGCVAIGDVRSYWPLLFSERVMHLNANLNERLVNWFNMRSCM